jgi:serine/threonine-protein kinase
MGSVWVAMHLQLETQVAIKFQHGAVRNPTLDARFRREARAAALLRGAHVVHIYDYGFDGGVPFIAMELLNGQSVATRLHANWALSVRQAATVVRHASRALDLAHARGIVHRDIKPSNLFVAQESGSEVIKLLDFGIAKWIDSAAVGGAITDSTMVLGSVAYMSPEQACAEIVDHRTDVWSLGVVAYQMVTGVSPFTGDSIPEILNRIVSGTWELPSAVLGSRLAPLDELFTQVLQRNRARRYQSAGEFSAAFMRIGATLPLELLDVVPVRAGDAHRLTAETRTIR